MNILEEIEKANQEIDKLDTNPDCIETTWQYLVDFTRRLKMFRCDNCKYGLEGYNRLFCDFTKGGTQEKSKDDFCSDFVTKERFNESQPPIA